MKHCKAMFILLTGKLQLAEAAGGWQYVLLCYYATMSKEKAFLKAGSQLQSPSLELLHQFVAWRDGGEWNYEKFVKEYIPRFLGEFRKMLL